MKVRKETFESRSFLFEPRACFSGGMSHPRGLIVDDSMIDKNSIGGFGHIPSILVHLVDSKTGKRRRRVSQKTNKSIKATTAGPEICSCLSNDRKFKGKLDFNWPHLHLVIITERQLNWLVSSCSEHTVYA